MTLLTGDIKIRSPPGTKHELIICTSEILRNKVVKLAGSDTSPNAAAATAQREAALVAAAAVGGSAAVAALEAAQGDQDLHNLGCVVSDEIHYINDVERGVVWEETLMHLPKCVGPDLSRAHHTPRTTPVPTRPIPPYPTRSLC